MAGAILDVYDKVFALAGVGENELDDLDIGSLVVAADVVHLAGRALFKHSRNGGAVILNVQPVPYLHTVTVDRQLLIVQAVVYHKRDELLWELVRAVVIRAASDVDGHTIGLVVGTHQHIRRGFGGGVRTVRGERGRLGEHTGRAECAVYLVSRDLKILHALAEVAGILVVRVKLPVALSRIE